MENKTDLCGEIISALKQLNKQLDELIGALKNGRKEFSDSFHD